MTDSDLTFADWRAVCAARYTFAAAVDGRDWPLLRSVLTDELRLDYSSYSGKPAGPVAADAWVERCRGLFEGLDATQHSLSNPQIEPGSGVMTCTMYVVAEHLLGPDRYTLGGYYRDVLVREGDRWLLHDMTLTVRWRHGDPDVLSRARAG